MRCTHPFICTVSIVNTKTENLTVFKLRIEVTTSSSPLSSSITPHFHSRLQNLPFQQYHHTLIIHISVKNHPIFMKFCTQQQILNWLNVTWSKMKKLHWTDEFDRTYFLFIYYIWSYPTIPFSDERRQAMVFGSVQRYCWFASDDWLSDERWSLAQYNIVAD